MPEVILPTWVTTLNDKVADLITSNKTMKFNTNKNRKILINNINKLINDMLRENVASMKQGRMAPTITSINPDGATLVPRVSTQSMSEHSDDFAQKRLANNKNPARSW